MICMRTKLDPFQRQISGFISKDDRGNRKLVIVTTIDGYRSIAERSGDYEGQTPPLWCDEKGKWCEVWLQDKPPAAAKVGIHRRGAREPIVGIARFSSFAKYRKGDDGKLYLMQNWKNMSDHMIAKVAEAHALRKAFPNELSGLYTNDEIEVEEYKESSKVREYGPTQAIPPAEPAAPPIQSHPQDIPQSHPPEPEKKVEDFKEQYEAFLSVMEFNEISHKEILGIMQQSKLATNETKIDQLKPHVLKKLVTQQWIDRIIEVHEARKKEGATK